MASNLKPIKVWGAAGPNPAKVHVLLKELGIPYEVEPVSLEEVKQPKYLAINVNGRMPAIEDPNTGLTLWESGAILEYLTERYDRKHQLSFPSGTNEAALLKQWLYFQTTGQGPYYGQYVWFLRYHPEKLPSALERYKKEILRVTSVLEQHLAKQKEAHPGTDGPWLVGNKYTYADMAFTPWQLGMRRFDVKDDVSETHFPLVNQWLENMLARKAVKAGLVDTKALEG